MYSLLGFESALDAVRPEEYRKRNIAANDGWVQENCTDPYLPCAAFAQVKLIEPGLHEVGIQRHGAVAEEERGKAGQPYLRRFVNSIEDSCPEGRQGQEINQHTPSKAFQMAVHFELLLGWRPLECRPVHSRCARGR